MVLDAYEAMVFCMAKRVTGAKVNRSAARKAAEVAALRAARRAAYEADVTAAVTVYFDRFAQAAQTRAGAQERADRILAEAQERADRTVADAVCAADVLQQQAEDAVLRLKTLGEPVMEIADMLVLPVATVRAALAAAARRPIGTAGADPRPAPSPVGPARAPDDSAFGGAGGLTAQPAPGGAI